MFQLVYNIGMNILYLNTTYQCGGAEKVVTQLFNGMRSRGHQVYQIVSYDTKHSALPADVYVLYPSLPMRIFNRLLTRNHSNSSLHIWYSRSYILRFAKKHQIDIIHLHNPHDNFLGIGDISDIARKYPLLWTLHDFWALTGHCTYPYGCDERWKKECPECPCLDNYPAIRRDIAHQLFLHKRDSYQKSRITFTVPSRWMKEQFSESYLKDQPCRCIYNSVDLNVWKALDKNLLRQKHHISRDKKVIAFIAADPDKPLKGSSYLIQALKRLPDPENYILIIAGKQSRDVGRLQERFHLWHWGYLSSQQDLNEFYSLADILINPSVYETFGLTTIEAMACGTPVVAFPVCTMPEIINDICGWIASGVSASALSEAIQAAFKDYDILSQKGISSRKQMEKYFSEETMTAKFENLYKEIISESNQTR